MAAGFKEMIIIDRMFDKNNTESQDSNYEYG